MDDQADLLSSDQEERIVALNRQLHWSVFFTVFVTTLGLVAFASALERYFIRKATLVETVLFALSALGLFWPEYWSNAVGLILFILVAAMQKMHTPAAFQPDS